MLTDRRPILLANARVIDPSRDLDASGRRADRRRRIREHGAASGLPRP